MRSEKPRDACVHVGGVRNLCAWRLLSARGQPAGTRPLVLPRSTWARNGRRGRMLGAGLMPKVRTRLSCRHADQDADARNLSPRTRAGSCIFLSYGIVHVRQALLSKLGVATGLPPLRPAPLAAIALGPPSRTLPRRIPPQRRPPISAGFTALQIPNTRARWLR